MKELQGFLSDVGTAILRIEERKEKNKENFNFFSAIVSGKNDKKHIEKYHSNFIAYLLNPMASHGFGNLFQIKFFEELAKLNVMDLPTGKTLIIERERETTEGRFIDISMELGKDWIVFIENKIWSTEELNQMQDYCDFAINDKFRNRIGIYLTLNGTSAKIDKAALQGKIAVVNLSYKVIVTWLKSCCEAPEVVPYIHVTSALKQYILIVENLLKIMSNDKKEIIELITENKENIKIAEKFLEIVTWNDITFAILEKLKTEIERVATELELKIKIDIADSHLGTDGTGFYFYKEHWKHCIYFKFEGDEFDLFVGLDDTDYNDRCDGVEKNKFRAGFQNIEIVGNGSQPSSPQDWMWVEHFNVWSDTSWCDILDKIPNEIKTCCEKILNQLEKIENSNQQTT